VHGQLLLKGLLAQPTTTPQTLFRAPRPWSRRSRPDQVDYWEGALHILYIKSCLKMIDHGSICTWGPGPSGSGFWTQKYDPPPPKTDLPNNFCFMYMKEK